MAPPQVTAAAEGGIRSLSRAQLAALLYDCADSPATLQLCLREFRRRFWSQRWEEAEAGGRLNIPPASLRTSVVRASPIPRDHRQGRKGK